MTPKSSLYPGTGQLGSWWPDLVSNKLTCPLTPVSTPLHHTLASAGHCLSTTVTPPHLFPTSHLSPTPPIRHNCLTLPVSLPVSCLSTGDPRPGRLPTHPGSSPSSSLCGPRLTTPLTGVQSGSSIAIRHPDLLQGILGQFPWGRHPPAAMNRTALLRTQQPGHLGPPEVPPLGPAPPLAAPTPVHLPAGPPQYY